MKKKYLILSIIGFILPNIWVAKVSMQTGNILLWWDIRTTLGDMFANDISTVFMVDLLFVVIVFFVWSYQEAKKHQIPHLYAVWLLTMLFGVAGTLPLFLFMRERYVDQ
jgi:hypothetical protein